MISRDTSYSPLLEKHLNALPLIWKTPEEWAFRVSQKPLELLSDHAHLEKKAALNALELLNRWGSIQQESFWCDSLAAVAKDESLHLEMVLKMLKNRGGVLSRIHHNPYAQELRKHVRSGKGVLDTLDRLLVSALIEARSCERFILLTSLPIEKDLALFYQKLVASESGHYKIFLDLAESIGVSEEMASRWQYFLDLESDIISKLSFGYSMHSGIHS
ncbi:MAG: tRNA isopentenyl-2-thiomethyl-A-37 hydroxylase MiaE [Chloroherpetonaceae bacterium]|nr:tRNA isopentenyl-2-thiomethyl-A-37 hydroxylase MiaE [Chloroherpetonaceae bacterium]